jgi:hypothetical protein
MPRVCSAWTQPEFLAQVTNPQVLVRRWPRPTKLVGVSRRAWRIATEVTPNNPYTNYCHKFVAIQNLYGKWALFGALDQ